MSLEGGFRKSSYLFSIVFVRKLTGDQVTVKTIFILFLFLLRKNNCTIFFLNYYSVSFN